jgi:broad specificity phosphatase PhoE
MRVFIVRHGESEGNAACTLQGSRSDTPLGPRGIEQARFLAERLATEPLDAAFTSPMIRARQTAKILTASHPGLMAVVDADLPEFDWGSWSGKPLDAALEAEVASVRSRWKRGETSLAPDGGESPEDAARRAERFLERLRRAAPRAPLVVAHGRFNRILMAVLLGRPLSRMDEIRQRNASLSVFDWSGEGPSTPLVLDDVSHLPEPLRTASVLSDSVK